MDVRALIQRNQDRMNALYASQDQTARYESLAEAFRAHFGGEPELFVSAPGRTEVVGNHTDHNNGRVLAASVNLDTVAAIAPRADGARASACLRAVPPRSAARERRPARP